MNAQAIEMDINKMVVDSIAKMMKDTLFHCAENIIANFEMLKDCNEDDRRNRIFEICGLNAETVCKIKAPVKKATEKKAKVAKLPIPFLPRLVDPNKCHGLTTALFTQCSGKKVDGSNYCSKCSKNLVDGIPKNGTIEMRTRQYDESKFVYIPPITGDKVKPKKIYYMAHVNRIIKKHPELDSTNVLLAHLSSLNCTDAEIDILMTKPPTKGKGKGKGKGKKEEDEDDDPTPDEGDDNATYVTDVDDDDDSSVATEATEATEADGLDFPDVDEDNVDEQPAKSKSVSFQEQRRPKSDYDTRQAKINGESVRFAYVIEELNKTNMKIADAIGNKRIKLYKTTGDKTNWEVVWPLEEVIY